jgi:hypothetical protein
MHQPGYGRDVDRRVRLQIIASVGVVVATGIVVAILAQRGSPSDGRAAGPPSPTATTGRAVEASVATCRNAVRALRSFGREAGDAYRPVNDLSDEASDARRIDVYRRAGARLFTIETEIKALTVPSELAAAHELMTRFISTTRKTYEDAVGDLEADGGADVPADVQTSFARAVDLYRGAYDELDAFEPRSCG